MKAKSYGFGMVEAIVSVSIAAMFLLVLGSVNFIYMHFAFGQDNKIQASFLAEESLEAVRFLRDTSWDGNMGILIAGTDYYPVFNGTGWLLQTTPVLFGTFDRKVRFDQVYRDSEDNITTTGGTLDPTTFLLTASVSWQEKNVTFTKTISTYITDLFSN